MRTLAGLAAIVVVIAASQIASAADQGFIFGTITTEWGDQYTGRIRWDQNEGFWDDILDATKDEEQPYTPRRASQRKKVSLFGLKIYEEEGWGWSSSSSAQLRFGHIKSIEPRSRDRALVTLKNGEVLRFEGSGSDLGSDNRGIVMDVEGEGILEMEWRDVEHVEFFPEPDDYTPSDDRVERLYGRVTTEDDETHTGFIVWDADEIYTTDVLDGDEDGRDREIRFGRIAAIEKRGSDGCLVQLANGRDMRLTGSNDVDSGNRGISIVIADLGRLEVEWDNFRRIDFVTAPAGAMPTYDRFDGGRRLRGTVTSEWGDSYTGEITWDNDERYSWEFLNGETQGFGADIEFGAIASIKRLSRRGCQVTLRNGMSFELRGSNDVDEDNKGVFVETDEGDLEELDWDDFEKVEFSAP